MCRSFQGFSCLMQISTRSRDYIIDTLALRSNIGAALARPFADASILKVLHGANSDVMWLQKDFGLFLVNMMDTGQAAVILDLPRGLAGLLQHFCQVSVRALVPVPRPFRCSSQHICVMSYKF